MSGHSKWKTIKHKKALTDAKKSKHFSKLIREIEVCARTGGGDPNGNATLRTLLDKAREINMPIDNAMRAIKKGTGELAGESYESFTYEGYGPHNIAVLVDVLTSNKNRTVSDLRHIFNYRGGHLGATGSVAWMFERKGVIIADNAKKLSEDDFLEMLIDFPIDEIKLDDGLVTITADPKATEEIRATMVNAQLPVKEAELAWVAKDPIQLGESAEQAVIEFLEELEDLDDVQNVHSNLA